jgi:hypothetical protein
MASGFCDHGHGSSGQKEEPEDQDDLEHYPESKNQFSP